MFEMHDTVKVWMNGMNNPSVSLRELIVLSNQVAFFLPVCKMITNYMMLIKIDEREGS